MSTDNPSLGPDEFIGPAKINGVTYEGRHMISSLARG